MKVDPSLFLTPEGRWKLLQDWIEDEPQRSMIVDHWLDQTADEIFPQAREIIAEIAADYYGPLGGALARAQQMTPEIRNWIESLQTCYRERKALDVEQAPRRVEAKSDKKKKKNKKAKSERVK